MPRLLIETGVNRRKGGVMLAAAAAASSLPTAAAVAQPPIAGYEFVGEGRCTDASGENYERISHHFINSAVQCGPQCDGYRSAYGESFRGFTWRYYIQGYGSSLEYGTCSCELDASAVEPPIDDTTVTYPGAGEIDASDGYSQTSSHTDVCYRVLWTTVSPTSSPSGGPSAPPSSPPHPPPTSSPTVKIATSGPTSIGTPLPTLTSSANACLVFPFILFFASVYFSSCTL